MLPLDKFFDEECFFDKKISKKLTNFMKENNTY